MAHDRPRFLYIDLLRGWAVLVMIEVHVFNAFLRPVFREEGWFAVLNFVNGLVAPSFLFASGYAFVLVAQRKWGDYLTFSPVFTKQAGRILQILAVGYALHLPVFSFAKLAALPWEGWGVFWRIDVLHAIAVSLLTMLLLVVVTREQKRYFIALCLLAGVTLLASPLMYDRHLDHLLPVPIANYLTAAHRSQFPLFPWMTFVLAGGIAAQLTVWSGARGVPEERTFRRIAATGAAFIAVSLAAEALPWSLYPPHEYWRSNPGFVLIRIGIVMLLLSGLWLWERRRRPSPSLVSIVGAESLVAYSGHLLVLYGQFFDGHSLAFLIGRTKGVADAVWMTAALIAVTVAASVVWHRIKKWSMFYARVLMWSILLVVLFLFLTKPY